jgi:hypothetical protein
MKNALKSTKILLGFALVGLGVFAFWVGAFLMIKHVAKVVGL